MTIETAWKYFLMYRGLNLHYKDNSKYDYSKYGPLTKGSKPDEFEYSADRFVFIKLAKSFPREEDYLDFLHWRAWKEGKLPYFRNLAHEPDVIEFKATYYKTKLSITYNFTTWMRDIDISYLKTNGEDHPKIIEDLLSGNLHIDFYYILDRTFNLTKKYLEIFENDILLQTKLNKYNRYRLVARVDEYEKLSKQILEHIKKG